MTARAIARQYAHALFDVAEKSRQTDRIGRDVADFVRLMASHEELARALTHHAVPPKRKRAAVEALLQAWPDVTPEVGRLLVLLADRDRLSELPEIAAAFEERQMELKRAARAELTTPAPVDDKTRQRIVSALSQALGREVSVTERVDAALVGGFTARVGSIVFDGSVRRHLERIRERLLNDASS